MKSFSIIRAEAEDLESILQLQYLAYQSEALLLGDEDIPPLRQTLSTARICTGRDFKTCRSDRQNNRFDSRTEAGRQCIYWKIDGASCLSEAGVRRPLAARD